MTSTQLFVATLIAEGLTTLIALIWIGAKYGRRS